MDVGHHSLLFEHNNNLEETQSIKSKKMKGSLIERLLKIVSMVVMVRESDSLKLAAFILLSLLLAILHFPKTSIIFGALYGWYTWNCYKTWCSDFKQRFPRENHSSPSHKDVPRPSHDQFGRNTTDGLNEKGRRLHKISHSNCKCVGKVKKSFLCHQLNPTILSRKCYRYHLRSLQSPQSLV